MNYSKICKKMLFILSISLFWGAYGKSSKLDYEKKLESLTGKVRSHWINYSPKKDVIIHNLLIDIFEAIEDYSKKELKKDMKSEEIIKEANKFFKQEMILKIKERGGKTEITIKNPNGYPVTLGAKKEQDAVTKTKDLIRTYDDFQDLQFKLIALFLLTEFDAQELHEAFKKVLTLKKTIDRSGKEAFFKDFLGKEYTDIRRENEKFDKLFKLIGLTPKRKTMEKKLEKIFPGKSSLYHFEIVEGITDWEKRTSELRAAAKEIRQKHIDGMIKKELQLFKQSLDSYLKKPNDISLVPSIRSRFSAVLGIKKATAQDFYNALKKMFLEKSPKTTITYRIIFRVFCAEVDNDIENKNLGIAKTFYSILQAIGFEVKKQALAKTIKKKVIITAFPQKTHICDIEDKGTTNTNNLKTFMLALRSKLEEYQKEKQEKEKKKAAIKALSPEEQAKRTINEALSSLTALPKKPENKDLLEASKSLKKIQEALGVSKPDQETMTKIKNALFKMSQQMATLLTKKINEQKKLDYVVAEIPATLLLITQITTSIGNILTTHIAEDQAQKQDFMTKVNSTTEKQTELAKLIKVKKIIAEIKTASTSAGSPPVRPASIKASSLKRKYSQLITLMTHFSVAHKAKKLEEVKRDPVFPDLIENILGAFENRINELIGYKELIGNKKQDGYLDYKKNKTIPDDISKIITNMYIFFKEQLTTKKKDVIAIKNYATTATTKAKEMYKKLLEKLKVLETKMKNAKISLTQK